MPHKYRVAIIGAGMICNAAHLPALTPLRKRGAVEVVAVADIRPEAARETAQRYEIPAWYDDPQKMLDEVKPDWVSVCTPNRRHNLSILALRAGANVMCEKPLALTWREAKEMFDVARQEGKLLFPCQSRRWSPDMDFASDVVRKGLLGKPYFADLSFVRRYGIPTWGMFHMKSENGGGPFCDLGVHFLDSLLWMTGNPRVVSVSGSMYDIIAQKGEDVLLSIKESGAAGGLFTPRPYDPASSAWRTPPWQHAHGRGPVSQLQVYLGHASAHRKAHYHLRRSGRSGCGADGPLPECRRLSGRDQTQVF